MSKSIVIIGSGIIGLNVALQCARRGHRVTVVERGSGAEGCSFGNAGMIVPSHFVPLAAPGMVWLGLKWMWNPESPFYIKPRLNADLINWGFKFWRAATKAHVQRCATLLRDMHLASRAAFERLAGEPGNDFGLVRRGLLMLCKTSHTLEEEAGMAVRARELGIPAEVLDARQTAALDPAVQMDIAGSVYFPQDCHLSPGLLMQRLHHLCDHAGVTFRYQTNLTRWERTGSRVTAHAGDEALPADEYVLCGGAWSPDTVKTLGLRLPMQAGKGYSLTLPKPAQLPELCSILTEARVAVTPMNGQLRVGGTMEIAGNDLSINPRRVHGIIKAMPHYFPAFKEADFDNIQPWAGLRPCSPDGLPYIGRTQAASNLLVATGHAMMGLSLAPVTGELIAPLVDSEPPALDLSLLSPDRFA